MVNITTTTKVWPIALLLSLLTPALGIQIKASLAFAPLEVPNYRVVVNSNEDGPVTPNGALTLREAIELTNGAITYENLSAQEKGQVTILGADSSPTIAFNLSRGNETITLNDILPPLISTGLTIDGTTNPGYDSQTSATAEIEIPVPVVSITPAPERYIFRGLTVAADNVTIKGLSIYGFTAPQGVTSVTPPADIFIARLLPKFPFTQGGIPENTFPEYDALRDSYFDQDLSAPTGVKIENNWLGITPSETMPGQTSAFGVSVFNGIDTVIRNNRISFHQGSGIITSRRADGMKVINNIITANGIDGMPDAIRLDGNVDKAQITSNLICGNDGSGVYLFKTKGSITLNENDIKYNGRRLRRAAVYLMGNDHLVVDNRITNQTGPGVVVTAYPKSDRNLITRNTYGALEGLSIDLITRNYDGIQDYQVGDGSNPVRNSGNRRLDTGNGAINTPQFLSDKLFLMNGKVAIDGLADEGSTVDIYKVNEYTSHYGPVQEFLTSVTADGEGKFTADLQGLKPGDLLTAIATVPKFGTSEPAYNGLVVDINNQSMARQDVDVTSYSDTSPVCVTKPAPPPVEPPVTPPDPEPPVDNTPQPIRIKIPRNVHFALDKYYISPASASILDKVVAVLKEYPFLVIELQGHTDPRASNEYNIALGRNRSISTRNYLLSKGIAPERMTIRTFGEEELLTPGTSVVEHARNRRVEIDFIDLRGLEVIYDSVELIDLEDDLQLER